MNNKNVLRLKRISPMPIINGINEALELARSENIDVDKMTIEDLAEFAGNRIKVTENDKKIQSLPNEL